MDAGWSSLVARRAHNPKVVSSNLAPATNVIQQCFYCCNNDDHIDQCSDQSTDSFIDSFYKEWMRGGAAW
ncbi:hypothetical protein V5J35_000493 [Endozoicomonas sp. NE40]|uniref:Uncharacterized protein n=1 Tax=Endozoicomonas lisbonensis TaxID=3120522 RepID=A0ABV2SC08_9GAMM